MTARLMMERFCNVPLAVWPGAVPRVFTGLRPELLLEGQPPADAETDAYVVTTGSGAVDRKPYDVHEGVAIVWVWGILVQQACWYDEMSYESIGRTFVEAMADPEVKAVVLCVCSPGGEVTNCFDLAELIYAARGTKPIYAVLDEYAYSAAYAIASAADKIYVPRTGGTGSIGVISMHVDITKALEEWGVKVTTFQYGERKSDSYPTTPLSDEAKTRYQGDVNKLGEMFVEMVARNRGLKVEDVRATQAGTFLGEAGVEMGLADGVAAPDEALQMIAAEHK